MDISYWEQRSNGLWLKNENREHFVKKEHEFNEEEFKLFAEKNKFVFPETYVNFLKKYNGIEIDKHLSFKNSHGSEISTIVPLVIPFKQAMPYFERLQEHKKARNNYWPIALKPTEYGCFLLKVKGLNKGKIYMFDGIMNEITIAFENIETFFNLLDINI